MQPSVIGDQIRRFIVANFPVARHKNVGNDDRLLETGILDSLGVLTLVTYIEQEFGMHVDDEELVPENFESIGRLVAFVRNKQGARLESEVVG